jgi:uncharacterized protein YeaO (DUF488 family)
MPIAVKRIYDQPSQQDGYRVLVDRLWPRGVSKEKAHIDLWLKDAAPSTELRQWFKHDESKWKEFRARYLVELEDHHDVLAPVLEMARRKTVTFLYAARSDRCAHALVLKEYCERLLRKGR